MLVKICSIIITSMRAVFTSNQQASALAIEHVLKMRLKSSQPNLTKPSILTLLKTS